MPVCSVIGCGIRKTPDQPSLTIHRIPRNEPKKKKWLEAIGMGNLKPNVKDIYICSRHFDDKCFNKTLDVTRLRDDAVPFKFVRLREDMENYLYYTTMGGRAKLKKDAVPHKFTCQPNRSSEMSELTFNSDIENTTNAVEDTNIDGKNEIKPRDETFECRACLQRFSSDAGLIDLFQAWIHPWDGMGYTIAENLAKLANIELTTNDSFSKCICELCYQKLLDACTFSTSVHSNDQVLRRNTNESSEIWPKPIIVDNTILNNVMEVVIKQEPLSDNEADGVSEYMGSDVNMQPDFTNLDIKVEPEEIIQPHPIKITVNGTITNDQFAQNSMMTNGDILGDARIEVTVKQEPQSEDDDTEIVPDLPLECMLCAKSFNSVSGLKLQAHVIAQHSYKTVKRKTDDSILLKENGDVNKYVCALCRRKFTTSTDLMVHETCHNKHSCYGCNEKFDTFALLTAHREKCKAVLSKTVQKHKTLEDVKRPLVEIPQLAEIKIEPQDMSSNNSQYSDESNDASNVKVHLKIKSLSRNPEVSDNNDIEMKLDAFDAFREDDVIQ